MAKREIPAIPSGGLVGGSYTPPSGPLKPTHDYRSANQWIKMGQHALKTLEEAGDIDTARRKANNEEARKAGVLAQVKGLIFDEIKKPTDRYAREHWIAGYSISKGSRGAAEYDNFRRIKAKEFGDNPDNIYEDYPAFEAKQRQQWMKDNDITRDLTVLSFDSELNKNSVAHFSVHRAAQTVTLNTQIREDAIATFLPQLMSIANGSGSVENLQRNADGTPTTHTDISRLDIHPSTRPEDPVPSASIYVVSNQKNAEQDAKDFLKSQGNFTAFNAKRAEDFNAVLAAATFGMIPENRKHFHLEVATSLLDSAKGEYRHAEALRQREAFKAEYTDLVNLYSQLLLWKKPDGGSVWDASTQRVLKKNRELVINGHDKALEAIDSSEGKIVDGLFNTHFLSNISGKGNGGILGDAGSREEIRTLLMDKGVEKGWVTKEVLESPRTLNGLVEKIWGHHLQVENELWASSTRGAATAKREKAEEHRGIWQELTDQIYVIGDEGGENIDIAMTDFIKRVMDSELPYQTDSGPHSKSNLVKQANAWKAQLTKLADSGDLVRRAEQAIINTHVHEAVATAAQAQAAADWYANLSSSRIVMDRVNAAIAQGTVDKDTPLNEDVLRIAFQGALPSDIIPYLYKPRTPSQQDVNRYKTNYLSQKPMRTAIRKAAMEYIMREFAAAHDGATEVDPNNPSHLTWMSNFIIAPDEILKMVPGQENFTSGPFVIPEQWRRDYVPLEEGAGLPPLATGQTTTPTKLRKLPGPGPAPKLFTGSEPGSIAGPVLFKSFSQNDLQPTIEKWRKDAEFYEAKAREEMGRLSSPDGNVKATRYAEKARRATLNADALEMVTGDRGGVSANNGHYNWHNTLGWVLQQEMGKGGALVDENHPFHAVYTKLEEWYDSGQGVAVFPRDMITDIKMLDKVAFYGNRTRINPANVREDATTTELHEEIKEDYRLYEAGNASSDNIWKWIDLTFISEVTRDPKRKKELMDQYLVKQLHLANLQKLPMSGIVGTVHQRPGMSLAETRRDIYHGKKAMPWSFIPVGLENIFPLWTQLEDIIYNGDRLGLGDMVNNLREQEQLERRTNRVRLRPNSIESEWASKNHLLQTRSLYPEDSMNIDTFIDDLSSGRTALVESSAAETLPAHHIALIFMQPRGFARGIRNRNIPISSTIGTVPKESYNEMVALIPERMKKWIFKNPEETDPKKLIQFDPAIVRQNYTRLLDEELEHQVQQGVIDPLIFRDEEPYLMPKDPLSKIRAIMDDTTQLTTLQKEFGAK